MHRVRHFALFGIPAIIFGVAQVACGGDDTANPLPVDAGAKDATVDAPSGGDAGQDAAPGPRDGGNGGDGGDAGAARFDHIFLIMMENHGTDEIIGNTADAPFINSLVPQAGIATNYFGVTHPSLPNYLSLFSGDFQGIFDDCAAGATSTCAPEEFVPSSGDNTADAGLTDAQAATAATTAHMFAGQNLVDQLEAKQLTWKAYMQSIPAAGDTSEYAPVDTVDGGAVPRKLYAQKHNPFMYFSDIRNSPARMQQIVPFTQLATDIAGPNVPAFVWISPDQCHDMHGVSSANANAPSVNLPNCAFPASGLDHAVIRLGDDFLKDTVQKIQASAAWTQQNSALVVVWDEDDYAGYAGCCGSPVGAGGTVLGGARAPFLVLTSKNTKPRSSTTSYSHYSLLATIEQLWGLPCLANACTITGAGLMTSLFAPQ